MQSCSSGLCGSCTQCEELEGVVSVPVHTRKLSFAEKLLRKMDKVGDQLEANVLPPPSIQCTSCVSTPGFLTAGIPGPEATCGVEISEPTCGVENYSHPHDGQVYGEDVYDYEEEYHEHSTPEPRTAPVPRAVPRPQPALEPVPQATPAPRSAPSPATPTPAAPSATTPPPIAPTPLTPPPVQPAPAPTRPDAVPALPPRSTTPQLELPPSEEFTPRSPKTPQAPVEPPTLRVPDVQDPIRIPSPNSPSPTTPTPLDNLPDILVDPFQDDLSFQHRRNRMNGMEASNRSRIQAASEQRSTISKNSSSRLQANAAAQAAQVAPARSQISDSRPEVNREVNRGEVIRASAEVPAVDGRNLRSQGSNQAGEPRVNRVAVPRRM